tara:strand:+ start:138 stop:413 length:276 start_codon:yes stop_codon:yes gene_type:complete
VWVFGLIGKKTDMTEQQIQNKRIKELESEGYYVIKLIKTNKNGIPDLIAIPPNCGVLFSEIKKPKGVVSELQKYRLKELKKHGVKTEIYKG